LFAKVALRIFFGSALAYIILVHLKRLKLIPDNLLAGENNVFRLKEALASGNSTNSPITKMGHLVEWSQSNPSKLICSIQHLEKKKNVSNWAWLMWLCRLFMP